MLTVVGLGNPGAAYRNSRHNAGFMVVDGIAEGNFLADASIHRSGNRVLRRVFGTKSKFTKSRGSYVSVEGEVGGKCFLLVKPTTFMNESGKALSSIVRKGIVKNLTELLVVVDDINLDLGKIRLRDKGTAGGQNGLQSIIDHLGTNEFARLRVGIGPRPNGEDMKKYVLGSFSPGEKEILERPLSFASMVVGGWIAGGFVNAQNVISRQ